jgi:tetratricopeptide (TPR) repeat protein
MVRSAQKKQKQKQRKLRQRKARSLKKLSRTAGIRVPEPSAKVGRMLDEIHQCIDDGDIDEALHLLDLLANRFPKSAAVAEVELGVYGRVGDHARASRAAKRLLKQVPQNPEAMYGYADAALRCFRVSLALIQFRKFLDRWPHHELTGRAQEAIEVCESESRRRVKVANEQGGLDLEFENGGLEFYARHEESLEQLESHNLAQAIELLEQNIEQQPRFMSSRNNLAICHFYQGDLEEAVRTARATCEIAPDNRFAEANLIKIEFLSGNPEKANELAGVAMADPPKDQDPFTALVESFGYLGRDEDLIALSEMLDQVTPLDDDKQADLLHHFAVAHFRLGDKSEAERLWAACLDNDPNHDDALENLDDIDMENGHAAWSHKINKWLPKPFMEAMVKRYENSTVPVAGALASDNPVVATVVPALLDRGDPVAREFALNFAMGDGTPPMLAALKDFAFGTRGPDALRHKALTRLKEKSIVDAGPHRFYSRGSWTEIKLIGFEITDEPIESELWKSELMEHGYWAMREGEWDEAEEVFRQVLDREPDCPSARYNLAGLWQRRQRGDELERAKKEIRQIHADHPDYAFAALALAIDEADSGEMEIAKKLIGNVFQSPKLHISEAMMLLTTQVQVALFDDDPDTAESALKMMCQIAHEDDPRVAQLRERIDLYRLPEILSRGQIDVGLKR